MKKTQQILFLIYLVFTGNSFGQNKHRYKKLDSLINYIKNHKDVYLKTDKDYEEFELDLQNYSYTIFEEYYPDGKPKEIEIDVDYNFIFYERFNTQGEIDSLIDYFEHKIIIGKKPKYYDLYLKSKKIGDSLISKHFKPEIAQNIKLNIDHSSWINSNDKKSQGNLFENPNEAPKGAELVYSYNSNNTVIYDIITITTKVTGNKVEIVNYDGIPGDDNYVKISFNDALKIVNNQGYFITDYNISDMIRYGLLKLEFDYEFNKYFWVISKITKKEVITPKNACGYYKLEGKTIKVDTHTGKFKEYEIEQPKISIRFF